MNYLEYIEANSDIKQSEIESIMERYKTEPVGIGYIDIIKVRYWNSLNEYFQRK